MIKKILIAFLILFIFWAIYLMQVDPEAEVFFYSYSDQEKKARQDWLNSELINVPFVGELDPLMCWLNEELKPFEENGPCASNDELHTIISENQKLLNAYQHLKQKPEKDPHVDLGLIMNGNRLLMANLHLISIEGNPEKALNLWLSDYKHWKEKLLKGLNWIGHSLCMINLGQGLMTLSHILNTEHDFTKSEYAQISHLLEPIQIEELNLEKSLKIKFEELKYFEPRLEKGNYQFISLFSGPLINRLYRESQEFLSNTKFSYKDFCNDHKKRLKRKPNKSVMERFLIYGPIGYKSPNTFNLHSALRLVFAQHHDNTNRKLLNFIVLLKEKNIPSSQISAFIKDNLDLATNPLTGNPFIYDPEEKKISMDATECSEPWSISLSNFN